MSLLQRRKLASLGYIDVAALCSLKPTVQSCTYELNPGQQNNARGLLGNVSTFLLNAISPKNTFVNVRISATKRNVQYEIQRDC